MQWLAEICVRRPVFAAVLSIMIIVIGLAAYEQLGVDQFPKIDLPVVTVTTRLPGSGAEDVETEISDKIEAAVNTISGLDELRSSSSEGVSVVVASFLLEKNADVAAQEVRDRVNSVLADLPKNIDQPVVTKLDPDAQPIFYIAMHSEKSQRDTTEYADKVLRRRLENVAGVGEVTLLGGQKRQVNLWLDPVRMRALGITAVDVSRAVAAQNLTLPGGRIDASRDQLTLRIHGRVEDMHGMQRIIVKEGALPVRLEDIARV
ncbi:MAG TPA: efflux RND transporter permease subunit, partial [Myxococcota bacterium]